MPVQVVHVDDLATALALAATHDLVGVYNVAADGWLDADAARALLPRVRVPAVPQEVLERALRRTWATGMGDIPPGVVPYLVHPWVIANDKLKGEGWTPSRTNEEAINEALFALPPRRAKSGAITAAVCLRRAASPRSGFRRRRRRRRKSD